VRADAGVHPEARHGDYGGKTLKQRLFATGAAALAVVTFALTGCAGKTTPNANENQPPATSAPALSAKEAFISAVKKLNAASSKADITMDGAASMKGTALNDPAANKYHVTNEVSLMGTAIKTEMISIKDELWVRLVGMPGGVVPDKWMHVPADKVTEGGSLDIGDNQAKLESAAVAVERDGETGFKGTIDITKTGQAPGEIVAQLGDKAKSVPFTAKVDAQGRLTSIVVDMTAVVPGAGKLTTTYSGFGEPVTVSAPPAAEVVEMSAELLAGMNKAVGASK
jgi:hypothetical protein